MAVEEPPLSRLRLLVLTCSIGGLQVVWSTIMSNGTPFLITLGLPESLTALVWVFVPLCGVLVQPYMGMLADQSQHKLGRRRPFVLAGAAGTIVCILGIASTRAVVNLLVDFLDGDIHSDTAVTFRILVAVTWLYGLSFCLQPFQGGMRALIVETCPADQQAQASAYASLMTGAGNIVGYLFGYLSIKDRIGLSSISQFTFLCIIAGSIVAITVSITCYNIQEKDPSSLAAPQAEHKTFMAKLKHVLWSAKSMPKIVQKVCAVQFFAWMSWFPFLFYVTSYVGDLYAAPRLAADAHVDAVQQATIIEDAIKTGSLASLCFAIVAFSTNTILPRLVRSIDTDHDPLFPLPRSRRVNIAKAWSASLFFFAFLMCCTVFVGSRVAITWLVACAGVSWACTLWIPFTIIGQTLADRRARSAKVLEGELEPVQQDQAGVIMGLHNCAISAPQIIAAFTSSFLFWLLDHLGVDDGIGWILRSGTCASLIAGWLARKIDE